MKRHFNKKARQKLRIKQLGGQDAHMVEPDNLKSLALLTHAYADVYQKAFPLKEEQEPLSTMIESLKSKTATISIVGEDLDTDHPVLKGIVVGYYYAGHDVGLLGYIATAPAYQGQGLGRAMNEANIEALRELAAQSSGQLKAVFLECNLPTTQNDVMDPVKRIAMYERWGCVALPFFYKQPPLEKGADGVELQLMAEPLNGTWPEKASIKEFLTGIYEASTRLAGSLPPDQSPAYQRSLRELEALNLDAFYAAQKKPAPPKPPSP